MSGVDEGVRVAYILAAAGFVLGLHLMNSPATARKGNQLSALGMVVALVGAVVLVAHGGTMTGVRWTVLVVGALLGGTAGLLSARSVAMTAMPQMVSLFNAVGGVAAALIAIADYGRDTHPTAGIATATVLDVIIGSVTFAGSLVAAAKLQGYASQPVSFAGGRLTNVVLAVAAVGSGAAVIAGAHSLPVLLIAVVGSLAVGVLMVLPIGGADMPVVISLLNAFTGTAVAMAGFVLDNVILTVAGALVGASGGILPKLMADAMNRSVLSIMAGGFGTGASGTLDVAAGGGTVRAIAVDDAALQLAYADRVIVVPGYGLAAAQAQHEIRDLAQLLESRGVEVTYAIHPVAGRMPGHMNVLLAEANVPYDEVFELDEINNDFSSADVAFVIGANDVTNPAAKTDPKSAIYGMPILDVEKAGTVLFIKRSMASGYAGVDNELFFRPNTMMLFGDAKKMTEEIVKALA